MDIQGPSTIKEEVQALREGIRSRYRAFQQADPARYPPLEFNTSRANYEPLRDSFEEEFYRIRGYDCKTPTINIPSTNTLARLFTNDGYIPGKKILNTCHSYAQGPSQLMGGAAREHPQPPPAKRAIWPFVGGIVSLLIVAGIVSLTTRLARPAPSGFRIITPARHSLVERQMVIEGQVKYAETVWVVVRSKSNSMYWVQSPIQVHANGEWIGVVYIGRRTKLDEGHTYQVRAFVNPAQTLRTGDKLTAWPEAELATDILEVERARRQP